MQSLQFSEPGKPGEVLQVHDLRLPDLSDDQVRLKILASPINPADLNFIEGSYGVNPVLPAVPGIEACGEVVESRSPDFKPGERCIFLRRAGLWASHAQVPASYLFKLPAAIDPLQAAMLKVNPATAWRLLTAFADLPRGSWIIQNAANSGVGRCVIPLAKSLGVRTINLVRRAELIPQLIVAGADQVLIDDAEVPGSVRDICGNVPPLLAFNCVGGESALRQLKCLAGGGTQITFGAMALRPLSIPNGLLIFKDLRIRGLWITRWIESAPRKEIEEVYGRLAGEMISGNLHIPIDSTYQLGDFRSALHRLSDPDRSGKVLFVP
ncbi:MDR family NADPH-dependent oxidoreductase [Haloferula chungangensis]|uniref:enoyl-[acyl-carrier-protein] reductase n=1 Tax=Haloferula chungangensis TaxID=1048331 RepID=A0ABW2L804_9BACT